MFGLLGREHVVAGKQYDVPPQLMRRDLAEIVDQRGRRLQEIEIVFQHHAAGAGAPNEEVDQRRNVRFAAADGAELRVEQGGQ